MNKVNLQVHTVALLSDVHVGCCSRCLGVGHCLSCKSSQLFYNLNVIYIASPDLSGLATDPVVKEKIIEYMEKGLQDGEEGGTVLYTCVP